MNKHTAQTLKYYLGQEVFVKHPESELDSWCVGEIISLNKDEIEIFVLDINEWIASNYLVLEFDHYNIYPILKTAHDFTLNHFDRIYGELCRAVDVRDDFYVREICEFTGDIFYSLSFDIATDLLSVGYGACPCSNRRSESGYVDLFGMPCVTPEQVEEGIEL